MRRQSWLPISWLTSATFVSECSSYVNELAHSHWDAWHLARNSRMGGKPVVHGTLPAPEPPVLRSTAARTVSWWRAELGRDGGPRRHREQPERSKGCESDASGFKNSKRT